MTYSSICTSIVPMSCVKSLWTLIFYFCLIHPVFCSAFSPRHRKPAAQTRQPCRPQQSQTYRKRLCRPVERESYSLTVTQRLSNEWRTVLQSYGDTEAVERVEDSLPEL